MFSPRGQIVRTARLQTTDDGATLTLSAPTVLVTCHATAESRRSLRRAADRAGVVLEAVEGDAYAESDSTFNRRTGKRQRPESVQPNTFRAVGTPDGLRAVCSGPWVKDWGFAVNVRVPVTSSGNAVATPAAERRVRDGKREAMTRAEDADRAERRPYQPADPEAEVVRQLAPDADAPTTALMAELVRLAGRADTLNASERHRVATIRTMLGV